MKQDAPANNCEAIGSASQDASAASFATDKTAESAAHPETAEAAPYPGNRDAQLLAGALRRFRLTLVYGASGSGKTTLLRSGMLPKLRRRQCDRALNQLRARRHLTAVPDRRLTENAAERPSEVPVFMDTWSWSPIAALQTRIHEALAAASVGTAFISLPLTSSLAAWAQVLDARFLLVFDRFEEFLAAAENKSGCREFGAELLQLLRQPDLPVNVLICLKEDAWPQMERFCDQIDGSPQRPSAILSSSSGITAISYLENGRTPNAKNELAGVGQAAGDPGAVDPPAKLKSAANDTSRAPRRHRQHRWLRPTAISLALSALGAILLTTWAAHRPAPNSPAAGEATTVAAASTTTATDAATGTAKASAMAPATDSAMDSAMHSLPAAITPISLPVHAARGEPMTILTDAANLTDAQVARDLAAYVGPGSGIPLEVKQLPSLPRQIGATPRPALAIVQYDTLAAARSGLQGELPGGGRDSLRQDSLRRDSLRIVTPLYAEEIYFIVRADSPLEFIHQIKDRSISAGPAQSAGAATAALVYETMFGAPIAAGKVNHLPLQEAMTRLVGKQGIEQGIDVIVAISPRPPSGFFATEFAGAFKVLKLDRNHPASERALQSFLPVRALGTDGALARGPASETLAVMSFLVALTPPGQTADVRLAALAKALCADLPSLRRYGDAKWQQVQLGLQLEVGWPHSPAAKQEFDSCRSSSESIEPWLAQTIRQPTTQPAAQVGVQLSVQPGVQPTARTTAHPNAHPNAHPTTQQAALNRPQP